MFEIFPAVRWKVLNILKLKERSPEKHAEQLRQIEGMRAQSASISARINI